MADTITLLLHRPDRVEATTAAQRARAFAVICDWASDAAAVEITTDWDYAAGNARAVVLEETGGARLRINRKGEVD